MVMWESRKGNWGWWKNIVIGHPCLSTGLPCHLQAARAAPKIHLLYSGLSVGAHSNELHCSPTPDLQLISVRCHYGSPPQCIWSATRCRKILMVKTQKAKWNVFTGAEKILPLHLVLKYTKGGFELVSYWAHMMDSVPTLFQLSALHAAPSCLLPRSIIWEQTEG